MNCMVDINGNSRNEEDITRTLVEVSRKNGSNGEITSVYNDRHQNV